MDDKVNSISNNINHQKISIDEIYGSVNNNNENIQNIQDIYLQIKQLQTSVNELKIKNDKYELEMKQINKLEINNFDNITKDDKDIKINKKCLPFL